MSVYACLHLSISCIALHYVEFQIELSGDLHDQHPKTLQNIQRLCKIEGLPDFAFLFPSFDSGGILLLYVLYL